MQLKQARVAVQIAKWGTYEHYLGERRELANSILQYKKCTYARTAVRKPVCFFNLIAGPFCAEKYPK